jgi:AcrR family transcriptional regulator
VPKPAVRPGRRPGNQDTRGAILAAARDAFAARGFTGASMRGIAAAAGVDPALIHHYFDSKQALFLAVVELPVDLPALVGEVAAGDPATLGPRLVGRAVEIWEGPHRPALVAALRTTITDPALSRPLTEFLTFEVIGRLLRGPDLSREESDRRAGLAASQMIGLLVGRYLIELPILTDQPAGDLVAAVGPQLQRYIDGDFGRSLPDDGPSRDEPAGVDAGAAEETVDQSPAGGDHR